jgi:uncharacterized protein
MSIIGSASGEEAVTLTLVPESGARVGAGFLFNGPNAGEECRGCPFQRLCFGLEAGKRYVVQKRRDVTHPCALHEGGRVRVVEVAEAPFATSLESRHLRGTAATWKPIPCGTPECANYALCHPVGARPGRHEIVAQESALECPAGYEVTKVLLRPMQ